jgi:hypothetical protein
MADFFNVIEQFIEIKIKEGEIKERLSSTGERNMRQVERELKNNNITIDAAIGKFLKERNYYLAFGSDRHAVEKLKEMLKH